MTVAELIELLKDENPERIVIMSSDAEGNSHSPLSSFWSGAYRADTTWSGDVGMESIGDEDRAAGFTDEDLLNDGVPALILSPTN